MLNKVVALLLFFVFSSSLAGAQVSAPDHPLAGEWTVVQNQSGPRTTSYVVIDDDGGYTTYTEKDGTEIDSGTISGGLGGNYTWTSDITSGWGQIQYDSGDTYSWSNLATGEGGYMEPYEEPEE